MAQNISKASVGAFVLGGIFLLVLGIVTLGGKSLLSKDEEYSLYFSGSVNGLSVGAPVVFRGVPLGSVTKISLTPNPRERRGMLIAVRVRLSPDAFGGRSGSELSDNARHHVFKRLVDNGLRASLHLNSLVTGKYRVDLDMFPGTTPIYYSSNPDREIPTTLSTLDNLAKSMENIPLAEMAQEMRRSFSRISALLESGELEDTLKKLNATLKDTSELAANLNLAVTAAGKELPETMRSFRTAMQAVTGAATSADSTLKVASAALGNAESALSNDSPAMRKFQQAMQELAAAARSLRALADTLERNPEALLTGKGGKRR
ncbi:MAG: MlaD family protein [Desulfovibrionaceae bacterium]